MLSEAKTNPYFHIVTQEWNNPGEKMSLEQNPWVYK